MPSKPNTKGWLFAIGSILLVVVVTSFISYNAGKRMTIQEYESMRVDSTLLARIDSLFNNMKHTLDTSAYSREIIYKNTQTIIQKLNQSYEKANAMRPINDRDSLLRSLNKLSDTPF